MTTMAVDMSKVTTLEQYQMLAQRVKTYTDEQVETALKDKIQADTKANWDAQQALVSEKDVLYIYTDYTTYNNQNIPAFKVGDGLAYLIDLPFSRDDLEAMIKEHIANAKIHLSTEDRDKLESSIKANVAGLGDNDFKLVLTE